MNSRSSNHAVEAPRCRKRLRRARTTTPSVAVAALLIFACGGATQREPAEVVPPLTVSSSGTLLGAPFKPTSANASLDLVPGNDGRTAAAELRIRIADWLLQCVGGPDADGGRSVDIYLQFLGPPPIPPDTYYVASRVHPMTNASVELRGYFHCGGVSGDFDDSGDSVTITHHSSGYVAGHFAFMSGLSGTFSIPFACVAAMQPGRADAGACSRSTDGAAND